MVIGTGASRVAESAAAAEPRREAAKAGIEAFGVADCGMLSPGSVELVLAPGPGQISVHTPFVMRSGQEVLMFYSRADYPPGWAGEPCRRDYKICLATVGDEGCWQPIASPLIALEQSVCRPWVMKVGDGYRMYFVKSLSRTMTECRLFLAESKDLRGPWAVRHEPLLGAVDEKEFVAGPCVVEHGRGYRLYFTAAQIHERGDSIYVAESPDGLKFEVQPEPVLSPAPGTGWSACCYAPFVWHEEDEWRMLFAGLGADNRYRTFVAESVDGLSFSAGRPVIDLAGDERCALGAYKAVRFEGHVYFAGTARHGGSAIYRASLAAAGL